MPSLVLLLVIVGGIAWLVVRGRGAEAGPPPSPPANVEDDRRRRYAELDIELDRRLEAKRLRDLDDER